MKKVTTSRSRKVKNDLLPEYDLRGRQGIRGKYYRAYRRGHTVRIYEADGTVRVQHFTLAEGAVMLEPDVRAYFPNSEVVNQTLRSLIALVPGKAAKRKMPFKSHRASAKM
jgi:hypothetical protein